MIGLTKNVFVCFVNSHLRILFALIFREYREKERQSERDMDWLPPASAQNGAENPAFNRDCALDLNRTCGPSAEPNPLGLMKNFKQTSSLYREAICKADVSKTNLRAER